MSISISLKQKWQSSLSELFWGLTDDLRDSSGTFTPWETVKYSTFIDIPGFNILFWPSLAARIIREFQWPVEYTGFLLLLRYSMCWVEPTQLDKLTHVNAIFMGLDWPCNLLYVIQSNFIVTRGQRQTDCSQLHKKHAEVYQGPFELPSGKLATFLPVEAQEGRRHMAVHKLLSFKHSHLFLQKTPSLLNSASCFALPYCHLPQNAFSLLQTFWSPGCAQLQDSNSVQTKSTFLASFLIHPFLWKAQTPLVFHVNLWLCCRSLKPACGLS